MVGDSCNKKQFFRGPYLMRAKSWKCIFICCWSTCLKGVSHTKLKAVSYSRTSAEKLCPLHREEAKLSNNTEPIFKDGDCCYFHEWKNTADIHRRKNALNLIYPLPSFISCQHLTYLVENSFWWRKLAWEQTWKHFEEEEAKTHIVSRAPWIPPVWHYYSITA